jgi:hypothetical protein
MTVNDQCGKCADCGTTLSYRRGELKRATHLITGRKINVRNIMISTCGHSHIYERLGPMLDMLLSRPSKRTATWHPDARCWS